MSEDFELKRLHAEAIPSALAKALRYRMLNEPAQAESICLDVLLLDPENQQAQIRLVRLDLAAGDPKAAIAKARQYGALIEIPRLSRPPVIDGDPSDEVWREGFTADRFYHTTSTAMTASSRIGTASSTMRVTSTVSADWKISAGTNTYMNVSDVTGTSANATAMSPRMPEAW